MGGFYTYDNQAQVEDLGTVCSGSSDASGQLHCTARLDQAGEVELTVTATDSEGRSHQSATSVYVTRQGEIWFGGQDHDRMDVVAEQRHLQPGDTARLQVRMPFRSATALVAIEREGVMETRVVQLSGKNPTIELQVGEDWGPNVYVSVLAVRGRIHEVPWYSFFTWGFKAPRAWWTAFWYDGKAYVAPTALVDLSKPAYRLGVAELQVGVKAHEIAVQLTPDRPSYKVRETASVRVQATLPNGQPAAFAEVTRGRGGPGAAGAQPQPELATAGRHVPAAQLGRADGHRPDGNHRAAPLRPQGHPGRRRRRAQPHARAV